MSALLDTGFLLAVLDADDKLHEACVDALLKESEPLLPDAVLPELAYMVLRNLRLSGVNPFYSLPGGWRNHLGEGGARRSGPGCGNS